MTEKSKLTKEELLTSYISCMTILKELNITPILFYGTLLGLYRENNFIDGDDDIDVLLSREQANTLWEYCIKKGHRVEYPLQYKRYDESPFIRISASMTDIYVYKIIGNVVYIEWDGGLIYPLNDIFPLCIVDFYGLNVYIPNNTHKVITDTYGDNWNIPMHKSEYEWSAVTKVERTNIRHSFGYRSIINSIRKNIIR